MQKSLKLNVLLAQRKLHALKSWLSTSVLSLKRSLVHKLLANENVSGSTTQVLANTTFYQNNKQQTNWIKKIGCCENRSISKLQIVSSRIICHSYAHTQHILFSLPVSLLYLVCHILLCNENMLYNYCRSKHFIRCK